MISNLQEFRNEKERISYSILTHSTINEDLIENLKKKLENINKKLKDPYKKKIINDRIFSLITNLESSFPQKEEINYIFLVNSSIHKISMSKNDLKFCKLWNIPKLILDYDDHFNIEYFCNLFSLSLIRTVFRFSKSDYQVIEIDSTKNRIVSSHTGIDEDNIKSNVQKFKPDLLYGQNQILKKLIALEKDGILVDMRNISFEEVNELIQRKNIKENQELFKKEFIDNLNNPSEVDKLLFGRNEVVDAINNYMVKKLFINPKLYSILTQSIDSSVLNFDIRIVQPLDPGDYGQQLNKDYDGIVAIKYYA
tara:strand:- start:2326 stop:3252 length:927 start_codon:yes stop_codon:yes gene_type:complete